MSIIIFSLLFFFNGHAQAETVQLGKDGQAEISLEENKLTKVNISLPGKKSQSIGGIGSEFVPFTFDGEETEIAVLDLDKDGVEEFAVRLIVPPQAGALHVFRWNKRKKEFEPITFPHGKFLMASAFDSLSLSRDGKIEFTVKIYGDDGAPSKKVKDSCSFKDGEFRED